MPQVYFKLVTNESDRIALDWIVDNQEAGLQDSGRVELSNDAPETSFFLPLETLAPLGAPTGAPYSAPTADLADLADVQDVPERELREALKDAVLHRLADTPTEELVALQGRLDAAADPEQSRAQRTIAVLEAADELGVGALVALAASVRREAPHT
jgi:hypothetical protein